MPAHNQLKKLKQLALVATTLTSSTIVIFAEMPNNRAIAQIQPDYAYACFFTNSTGKTIDFSQSSLCGAQKTVAAAPLNTDAAFLAEYKRNALQYSEVSDSLLASVNQSPEVSSRQAQRVCNDLKTGMSLDEVKQRQSRETVEQSSIVNAQIVTNLATKYYCPNLGN